MSCSPTHPVPPGRFAFFGRIPGNKLPGYDHPVPFGTKSDASLRDNKSPRQLSAKSKPPQSDGVLEYCANSELHPAPAGLGMLSGRRQPTDPGFHRLRASTWFDPGAYCNRTPRDKSTTGGYKGSIGEWGIQPLWRVDSGSTHFPWSIHYPWNTRSPGCNSRYQICRKGRGTGEENPSSHFRLPPDVQSQARRKDRKGEPQFFSSGHRFRVVWHKPDKKGSAPARPVSHFNTIL